MDLKPVAAARARNAVRPSWVAIFVKAFAMVADEFPELRRTYLSHPWPHLYQYPENAALVMIERQHQGESVVFPFRIRNPGWVPLGQLSETIRTAKTAPVEDTVDFVRVLRVSALPWPLRRLVWWLGYHFGRLRANYFGTFVLSAYPSEGADPLHGIGPVTMLLTYGLIGPDGAITVRAMWDHRVLDGVVIARALLRLEEVLNTRILEELLSLKANTGAANPSSLPGG
ncbi:MAG: hypothetical protein R3D62_07495 [Xanthobacteraceae bacterium]